MPFILIPLFAILNRARGSRWWGVIDSTVEARLLATGFMAGTVALHDTRLLPTCESFLLAWASLMLWCTPAWDAYWSAQIGDDPAHGRFWGLSRMSLRMLLAAPCVIGLAIISGHPQHALLAFATPMLALPYLLFGVIDKSTAIPRSEYAVGALLGLLIMLTLA